MSMLHQRLLDYYEKLGLQEIDEDDYVDNLPEYITNLKYNLKFPIHADLRKNISFKTNYITRPHQRH